VLHHKPMRRLVGAVALIALLVSLLMGLTATASAAPPDLTVNVKAAVLMDFTTGQVLFERDADTPIPPASITKLMTLHLAYKKIADGSLTREDKISVQKEAWAANPALTGSSLMFLEPGQIVTVGEVMKGIAVPSGNDASVALAQHIAGSVDQFVAMMNQEAREMGFKQMTFADPHGLSPGNMVTARELAMFARKYVELHPESLQELHSVEEFSYPLAQNVPPGKPVETIKQYNRNNLLGTFEGVDGLKTGFIEESGYNIVLTAKRGDMRLIAVVLGAPGATEAQGSANRAEAGRTMLSWGFANFATIKPDVPQIKPVRVWKGAANEVALEPAGGTVYLTVARDQRDKVTTTLHQEESIVAPVTQGTKLGELVFAAEGKEIAKVDLVAKDEVKQGGFFKRLWDTIRLTVTGWFNRKK